jgi:integrase/recombinase XerD
MPRRKHLTWAQAADRFATHLRARNLSPRSVYGYGLEVSRLAEHLEPLLPGQVRTDDLRDYQAGLLAGTASRSGRPLTGRTVYRVSCNLATFFGWLKKQNVIATDPTQDNERPKRNRPRQGNVLTVAEAHQLLLAAGSTSPTGLRDRALAELLYATGVRREEVLTLDLSSFNSRERLLHACGKGRKYRVIPVTRAAALRLDLYLSEARPALVRRPHEPALFLTHWGKRIGGAFPGRLLRRLATSAEVPKNVTPHTMRSACSYC